MIEFGLCIVAAVSVWRSVAAGSTNCRRLASMQLPNPRFLVASPLRRTQAPNPSLRTEEHTTIVSAYSVFLRHTVRLRLTDEQPSYPLPHHRRLR